MEYDMKQLKNIIIFKHAPIHFKQIEDNNQKQIKKKKRLKKNDLSRDL